ncbi:C39 family peptidase [Campylobacter upsaliensis]|uniref:C39 family peptidase n=1 Tax=Campylobacter upsaliensis TaxID=28080 RepID=UPI002149CB18|nr:cysteine peptidase family C39 domain-containing protein [Campylobacter upsaliensis]MCR2101540.1 cysteine peptidase family C39 domain-containing protein [Campylobacter upsaliensis]MCR2108883.1 cysteine peptidase family C39 domain-containing protein [Campylobacter upsaliensis]MCR2120011.1 cysteine peptidase family C39 domain-containing protein [Campylobacter upsaliensis]MCR2123372.1 cysteine peptidase family C39 domain-containing protein [Campylobacter upsaliensis]MCR2123813.1 cysteine peptid
MEKILKIVLMMTLSPLFLKAEFVVKSYQEIKNEKVIRQNYEESCGAASLATLINILDDSNLTELDLLKAMSGQQLYTDMVSFADLNDAVKKLGFQSKSYKIDRKILESIMSVPILVKIEDDPRFPHFVVIINHKGNYLQIFDPSYGEYISSKREFYSVWDRYNKGGFALIINPKKQLKDYKLNLPKSLNFEIEPFGF